MNKTNEWPKEQKIRALTMLAEGLSSVEVAKRTGVPANTVRGWDAEQKKIPDPALKAALDTAKGERAAELWGMHDLTRDAIKKRLESGDITNQELIRLCLETPKLAQLLTGGPTSITQHAGSAQENIEFFRRLVKKPCSASH